MGLAKYNQQNKSYPEFICKENLLSIYSPLLVYTLSMTKLNGFHREYKDHKNIYGKIQPTHDVQRQPAQGETGRHVANHTVLIDTK